MYLLIYINELDKNKSSEGKKWFEVIYIIIYLCY